MGLRPFIACLTSGLALVLCTRVTPAQVPVSGGSAKMMSSGACTLADKVEASAFSVSPSQPADGQQVTVSLTLRNKCPSGTSPITVNWDISRGPQILAQGSRSLSAGTTSTHTATWSATAGTHYLYGGISSAPSSIGENSTAAANNSRDMNITVSPPLVTQVLDYRQALHAGANFNHRPDQITACTYYGQFDPRSVPGGWTTDYPTYHQQSVIFMLRGMPPCGKVTPEAFANFTLKNGWKVKDAQVYIDGSENKSGSWQWVTKPTAGSSNPYTRFQLQSSGVAAPVAIMVGVKVIIEGPQGTSPY